MKHYLCTKKHCSWLLLTLLLPISTPTVLQAAGRNTRVTAFTLTIAAFWGQRNFEQMDPKHPGVPALQLNQGLFDRMEQAEIEGGPHASLAVAREAIAEDPEVLYASDKLGNPLLVFACALPLRCPHPSNEPLALLVLGEYDRLGSGIPHFAETLRAAIEKQLFKLTICLIQRMPAPEALQDFSLLHALAQYNHPEGAAYCIGRGAAEVDAVRGEERKTALHCAAEQGHVAMCRLLITLGANPHFQSRSGWDLASWLCHCLSLGVPDEEKREEINRFLKEIAEKGLCANP